MEQQIASPGPGRPPAALLQPGHRHSVFSAISGLPNFSTMFCLARLGRHRNLIPGFPDSEVSKCEEPWRTPGRNVKAYHGRMEKTANAKKQHSDRAMEIINQLGEEYAAWFG
jgi:hypothetical protein